MKGKDTCHWLGDVNACSVWRPRQTNIKMLELQSQGTLQERTQLARSVFAMRMQKRKTVY